MNDNILSCMHFHTWQFASKDIYVVMFRIKILPKEKKSFVQHSFLTFSIQKVLFNQVLYSIIQGYKMKVLKRNKGKYPTATLV